MRFDISAYNIDQYTTATYKADIGECVLDGGGIFVYNKQFKEGEDKQFRAEVYPEPQFPPAVNEHCGLANQEAVAMAVMNDRKTRAEQTKPEITHLQAQHNEFILAVTAENYKAVWCKTSVCTKQEDVCELAELAAQNMKDSTGVDFGKKVLGFWVHDGDGKEPAKFELVQSCA